MDNTNIDDELKLWKLKSKLPIILYQYIIDINKVNCTECFAVMLGILERKYTQQNDLLLIRKIKENMHSYNYNRALTDISTNIFNCNNADLLKDLLSIVDIRNQQYL